MANTSIHGTVAITDLSELPSVFSLESTLEWLIDGMVARGSITMICAESGTGKTWLGYYLAGCLAQGKPVLGLPTKSCKVLYLDGENPLYLVKQRLLDLGIQETPDLTVWGGWNTSPPAGPDHPLIIDFAHRHKGLIVFDSLIEFHPGSEQSSTETRAFMRHFRYLANLGATIIILHHTGKAESSKQYRGSSDIKAAIDTAYLLTGNSEQPDILDRLSMDCFKSRLAPGRAFHMDFKRGVGLVVADRGIGKNAVKFISDALTATPELNQREITKRGQEEGYKKRDIEHSLKNGNWSLRQGPRNSKLFSLPKARTNYDEPIV